MDLPYPIDDEPIVTTEEGGFYEDLSFTPLLEELGFQEDIYIAICIYKGIRRYWGVYSKNNTEIFQTLNREDIEKYLRLKVLK